MTTPGERYRADRERLGFVDDPAQNAIVEQLDTLYEQLLAAGDESPAESVLGWWQRWRGDTAAPVCGLYLWGGVGRGKTYLMDLFYDCLPFPAKRRQHFHRFMQSAHERLRELGERVDPLAVIADEWGDEIRVLCFDEFFVTDISDAMILARLLERLFHRGVTLVATSNTHPDALYADGLQRARFLPAIELIKEHTVVMELAGVRDYRLEETTARDTYYVPDDPQAVAAMRRYFERAVPGAARCTTASSVCLQGRQLTARALAGEVVWFDFSALCEGPRSQLDYIEIAQRFATVLLSGVPILTPEYDAAARRFIALVDELYERRVKLIASAAAYPDALYRGRRLTTAFERTASRLLAMRSAEYATEAHRP